MKFVFLIALTCLVSASAASSLRGASPSAVTHGLQFASTRVLPAALPMARPGWHVAQLSRHEHDRLRTEMRKELHHPVNVGSLESLGLSAGRLSVRERRLLRRQLRQHRSVVEQVVESVRVDTSDSIGGEASEESRAVHSRALPEPARLNPALLEASAPITNN